MEGYPFALPHGELSKKALAFSHLLNNAYKGALRDQTKTLRHQLRQLNNAYKGALRDVKLPRDMHLSLRQFFEKYTTLFVRNIKLLGKGYILI